jgi:outer membrane receptor protein involved in Fe transport
MVINKDPISWTSNYPDPIADPQGTFTSDRLQQTYLFADTHTLSPNLILDLRFTFATRRAIAAPAGLGSDIVQQIGLRGVPSGTFPVISPRRHRRPRQRHTTACRRPSASSRCSLLTWVKGTHLVKFGGEVRRSTNYEIFRQITSGQFNFATTGSGIPGNAQTGTGFATFMLGFVNGFQQRETEVLDRYSYYLAGFIQDDWKISPTFTLNLGVRWETDTPITDGNDRMNSFDLSQVNPVSGTPAS